MRNELSSEHQKYIDEVEQGHASQMQVARIELERAIEISRQKVQSTPLNMQYISFNYKDFS